MAGATNAKLDYNAFGKGEGTMCTLFEEIATENRNKGLEKGILSSIRNLMESMNWSAEQAMEVLKIPMADRKKYAGELKK